MNTITKNHDRTQKLVGVGLFTAIVFVLQFMSAAIKLGTFSIASFALVTIVVGAALYGAIAGAWLGFVFGIAVLISGDAAPFLALSVFGTIATVLVKGTLAGLSAGITYRLLEKFNQVIAAFAAAVLAPLVNTSIFLLGCRLFFFETIASEGSGQGYNNTWLYIILFYVGLNFVVEFLINLALNPVIIRLVNIGKKSNK